VRGQEAQRRVGLEHVQVGWAERADLPDVIHHADAVEPGFIGGAATSARSEPSPAGPFGQLK